MRLTTYLLSIVLAFGVGCGSNALTDNLGGPCDSADDCDPGFTCSSTGMCEAPGKCTGHGDCGRGTICSSDGSCVANQPGGPCASPKNCVDGEMCTDEVCGEECGGQLFQAQVVPPNVLIVLDRSRSMTTDMDGNTRWDIALQAIDTVLRDFESRIRFGFMLFPAADQICDSSGAQCQAGTVLYDPQLDNRSDITTYLNGATTCRLGTPISQSLGVLVDYSGLEDISRANYVLLITDGEQRCTGDPAAAVQSLRNQTPEIKTFVVGFGQDVAGSQQLNDMAVAGGTDLPGDTKYYQAESAQALDAVLDAISGAVLSCDYMLTEQPPNSDELSVYFGTTPVERSDTNGWQYDAELNRIIFSGNVCTALQTGAVSDLKIIFGCPDIIVR